MSLWGGRFEGERDPLFRAFNDSLPIDAHLLADDIAGSRAWAGALKRAGVLTPDEQLAIDHALVALAEAGAADPTAVAAAGDEDIHSFVERALIEQLGDLGRKLHTGRSRNDQVALDLRLWTRREIDRRHDELRAAQRGLLQLAEREADTVIPGYTHLQRAQPVLVGHWCLAYIEMLERDSGRLADARRRLDCCPLGCGALSGTAYPIDRQAIADDLGMAAVCANSLDAVSDRDFVVEVLAAAALTGVHLSRLAEDLIFYASGEAGLVRFDDRFTSGSSLMPQKKNPDGLELIRGKTGRLVGALTGMLVTLKGLPLAYDKDLQEDKEPLSDAMTTLSMALRGLVIILEGTTFDAEQGRRAAEGGHANATELADYLVGRGIPFRTAHEIVGRAVRVALRRGVGLEQLSLEELQAFAPEIEQDVYAALELDVLLSKRSCIGGTSPAQVAKARAAWSEKLASAGSPCPA